MQQGQQKQDKQQLPKFPSKDKKDKKKDDKDQQQDQDDQSGNDDLTALLMGAASTRRRRQDQQQGPDTQALGQDASQAAQTVPGGVVNSVSDSVNLAQSSGQAAQGFSQAAASGASLASAAQSGAVNPMDVISLIQGISAGIAGVGSAVAAGAAITGTGQQFASQAFKAAGDADPALKGISDQLGQANQAVEPLTALVGTTAGGIAAIAGIVNTISSLGAGGEPQGGDPPPPPPDPNSWGGQITNTPEPMQPDTLAAAQAAQAISHVYDRDSPNPWGAPVPQGLQLVSSAQIEQWTGINPDNVASGLHVEVFTNGKGGYIPAFAGAQNQIDDATVVVEETGGNPAQYQDAVQLVRGLVDRFGAGNVLATGHSMGGGEAAAAALANGTSAITFEAQGLSPGYLVNGLNINPQAAFAQAQSGQIQHYFINGEFATLLQRQIPFTNGLPNAPGLNYQLPWVAPDTPDGGPGGISAIGPPDQAHDINAVLRSLQNPDAPAPQLVFTQPIPGESATESIVNLGGPILVEPIAQLVLNSMYQQPPPPAPPEEGD